MTVVECSLRNWTTFLLDLSCLTVMFFISWLEILMPEGRYGETEPITPGVVTPVNGSRRIYDCDYKLNLIATAVPSFKPAQTSLDICIADARLKLLNGIGGKAHTLPYDNDHLAMSMTFGAAVRWSSTGPCRLGSPPF